MSGETLSIVEAFKARCSIRTYSDEWTDDHRKIVDDIVAEVNKIKTPFGKDVSISVHDKGLGTMRFISGESGWLLLKIPMDKANDPEYAKYCMDAAFLGHICVMKMTQHKISTVWVGGTFNEAKAEEDTPGFKIPCVVAFGIASDKKHFVNKALSFVMKKSRYPYETLFYDEVAKSPIKDDEKTPHKTFLECIRWSPSALNVQPVRLSVNGSSFSLFDGKQNDYTPFDMGIVLGASYFYSDGNVEYDTEVKDITFHTGGKYICSFKFPEGMN